jgi:hypothetical protein
MKMARSNRIITDIDMKNLFFIPMVLFILVALLQSQPVFAASIFECESPTPGKALKMTLTLGADAASVHYDQQPENDFLAIRVPLPNDPAYSHLVKYVGDVSGKKRVLTTFEIMLSGGARMPDGSFGGRLEMQGIGAGNIWYLSYICKRN